MRELWTLPYSPWSEMARWALSFCGMDVQEREYVPIFGEFYLRARLRHRGRISVPILADGDEVIQGTLAIARHAARSGSSSLFPREHDASIEKWSRIGNNGVNAIRVLVTARVEESPDAKEESLPGTTPTALRGLLRPVATVGAEFLRRKYRYSGDTRAHRERLVTVLGLLRDGISTSGYLVGDGFTYADLAMATVLQGVVPVTDDFLKIGPATRAAWTSTDLAHAFPDLVEWRDQIYARHRFRGE